MAETPTRGGPTLVGTSAVAIATAGAASTWRILRSLTIANETLSTVTVSVGIHTSAADAAGRRIIASAEVQPGETLPWSGFLPLIGHASTPDLVYAIASVAASVTVTAGLVDGP